MGDGVCPDLLGSNRVPGLLFGADEGDGAADGRPTASEGEDLELAADRADAVAHAHETQAVRSPLEIESEPSSDTANESSPAPRPSVTVIFAVGPACLRAF